MNYLNAETQYSALQLLFLSSRSMTFFIQFVQRQEWQSRQRSFSAVDEAFEDAESEDVDEELESLRDADDMIGTGI